MKTRKTKATQRRDIPPIHPGEVLAEDFLKPLGITEYRLAKETSVPPRRINLIVKGRQAITADTALRLGRYFGTACAGPRDARQDFQVSLAHSVRAGATIPGLAPLARASAARRSSGARFRRAPDARPPWLYGAMAWLLRPPGRAYLVLLASVLRTFHGSQRQRGNNPFQSHELAGLTYKKSAKIIKYTRQLQIAIPRERPHARSQTAVLYIRDQ